MLHSAKALKGFALHGKDGVIGSARDIYFDDDYWTARYLVASTGGWLAERKVLISPYSLLCVDAEKKEIGVELTRKKIEDSPGLECHKPISRQFEETYYVYYGWPTYWGGPYSWGPRPYFRDGSRHAESMKRDKSCDPHLRSTDTVDGYHVEAADGPMGHVEDFIIDDETWAIRYLVVNTRNWLPGRKVLVSPKWIESISWEHSRVQFNIIRDAIRESPEYTGERLVSREYELRLYTHYHREGYWTKDELRH